MHVTDSYSGPSTTNFPFIFSMLKGLSDFEVYYTRYYTGRCGAAIITVKSS